MPTKCITTPSTSLFGCRQLAERWRQDAAAYDTTAIPPANTGPYGCINYQLNVNNPAGPNQLQIQDIPLYWQTTYSTTAPFGTAPRPAVIWIGSGCPRPCMIKAIRLGKNPTLYCRSIGQTGGSAPTMLDGG
jgi:hypothetical protein